MSPAAGPPATRSAAAGTSAAATATRRLLHGTYDRELWDVDGDLWCVHRPRLLTIMATTWWFTIMGFALFLMLMFAAILVFADETGAGWWLASIASGLGAVMCFTRGRRALHADRIVRASAIDSLPRVTIDRGEALVEPEGARVPLSDVRVIEEETDLGEATRHDLVLLWGDHRWLAFHAGRARRLADPAATLRSYGLRVTRRT